MYQNNASFFVRQFQDNMLRKQAGLPAVIPGRAARTLKEAVARSWVNPNTQLMAVPGQAGRVSVESLFRRLPWYQTSRFKNVMKYAKPVAAGAAAGAAAGGAVYGANKLTEEDPKERIKQVLYSYAPYVGGGALLGALLGGGIGYANDNTLLGSLGGTIAGAGLGAGAKYLYDRYNAQA